MIITIGVNVYLINFFLVYFFFCNAYILAGIENINMDFFLCVSFAYALWKESSFTTIN